MSKYVILYRTGGWAICRWVRLVGEASLPEAKEKVKDLTSLGYKALYRTVEEHDLLGLPVGWHWKLVNHKKDRIQVSQYTTEHIIPVERWEEVRDTMAREGIWA